MYDELPEVDDSSFVSLHPKQKLPLLNYRIETGYILCLQQENILRQLKERAAKFGPLSVPLEIENQISETETTIGQLEEEMKELEDTIASIKREIENKDKTQKIIPPQHRFGMLSEWPAFDNYIKGANEIIIVGGSLDNLTQLYGRYLVEKAKTGCDVRLVFMDPESSAIPQVELWSDPLLPKDYYRRAICRSLRHLAVVDDERKLKIRLNPSIPALTVVMLDASQPDGKIRVDIQPFQAVVVERPIFELTRSDKDRQWYELFYRQYSEKLWSIATPVDLSNLPSICL